MDKNITKRLISCGEIIGIEVLDHIIVAGCSYYSMLEHGDMDRLKSKISSGAD